MRERKQSPVILICEKLFPVTILAIALTFIAAANGGTTYPAEISQEVRNPVISESSYLGFSS
jgi:hypothetical protein